MYAFDKQHTKEPSNKNNGAGSPLPAQQEAERYPIPLDQHKADSRAGATLCVWLLCCLLGLLTTAYCL